MRPCSYNKGDGMHMKHRAGFGGKRCDGGGGGGGWGGGQWRVYKLWVVDVGSYIKTRTKMYYFTPKRGR